MAIVFIVTTVRNYNKEKEKNAKRAINKPTAPPAPRPSVAKPVMTRSTPPPVTQPVNTHKSPIASQLSKPQSILGDYEQKNYPIENKEEANAFSQASDKVAFMMDEEKEYEPAFDLHLDTKDDFKRAIIYSTILDRRS